jgi:hypothetical protein
MTRPLLELLSPEDEGWASITAWAAASARPSTVLNVVSARREEALLALQVTTRSVLGATAWHCTGVLLDHGWLRLLGGVGSDLPDLLAVNAERLVAGSAAPYLVIALDVLGGRFAVNGGGLAGALGEVAYFGPDTLDWLPTGLSHSAFVEWAFTGDIDGFYEDVRWNSWESQVRDVALGALLAVYPPLFTKQGRDLAGTTRRSVPWRELLDWLDDAKRQLDRPQHRE